MGERAGQTDRAEGERQKHIINTDNGGARSHGPVMRLSVKGRHGAEAEE